MDEELDMIPLVIPLSALENMGDDSDITDGEGDEEDGDDEEEEDEGEPVSNPDEEAL